MPVRPRCKARHHTWCLKACWPAGCPVPHWRVVTMRVVGLGRLPPLQKLATAEAGGWVRPAHLLDSLGGNPQWQCKLASRQRPFLPGACRACDDHCGLPWRGGGHAAAWRGQQRVDGGPARGGRGWRPGVGASHHGIAIATHGVYSLWCCPSVAAGRGRKLARAGVGRAWHHDGTFPFAQSRAWGVKMPWKAPSLRLGGQGGPGRPAHRSRDSFEVAKSRLAPCCQSC
jgi:hypothetical protein